MHTHISSSFGSKIFGILCPFPLLPLGSASTSTGSRSDDVWGADTVSWHSSLCGPLCSTPLGKHNHSLVEQGQIVEVVAAAPLHGAVHIHHVVRSRNETDGSSNEEDQPLNTNPWQYLDHYSRGDEAQAS